ncbi:MAG: hypothetical protein HY072_07610 [Deltaproteobacteria bacterium]|nr:hypothetical protein [Deltaproteobacteria bacterium]
MSKTLLLISSKHEDWTFAQEVSMHAGLTLQTVNTAAEGIEILSGEGASAVMVDASTDEQYHQFENAIQDSIGLFSEKINANTTHFITSEELERVPYLIQSPLFGNYIIRNYGDIKDAGALYGRILYASLTEKAFGLKSFLKEDTKIQTVKFRLSTQKQDAVEAVKNFLIAAKFQTRMATIIATAVDEILMNAMYDAPVDDLGKPTLSTTPRSAKIELQGKHQTEMAIGFDGKFVGISATDLFGSLDKAKLLSFVAKIYTDEEYKVKMATAGAGLGLATVFRSGGSLFFVSESRVKTEVTVFFMKTANFRDFKDQFRFLTTQFYF